MYTLGPAPTSTLRTIPFTIPTSAWTESNGIYTATFSSVYITESSKEMCTFDESLRNRAKRDINISKTSGGGSITLTTSDLPTGAISGTIFTIDADDGKICMVIEDTVLPIANGGTGANTLAGAKENLGISAIAEQVEELDSKVITFPDYAHISTQNNVSSFTCTQDCWLIISKSTAGANLIVNGVNIWYDSAAYFGGSTMMFRYSGFFKVGDAITMTDDFGAPLTFDVGMIPLRT